MYNYLIKVIKLLFFSLFIVNFAAAAPLINFQTLDLAVELSSETDGIFRLSLTSLSKSKQISDPEILELKDPYRLVLDLPEFASKSSRTVNVSSAFISSLRMGAHADKTRFVIDMKADYFPEYQIIRDKKTNALTLEFVFAETSPMFQKTKEEMRKKEEKKIPKGETTSTTLATPTPKTTSTITTSTTTTTSSTITSITSTTINPATVTTTVAAVELQSIYFQITENTNLPAVAFEIPGLKSYALNKLTEELYELVLDNTYLKGKHLELPQFPPDSFIGFAVINAAEDQVNNKVVIKIYVDEGTKLFPYYMNDQLWVKVGN